MIASTRHLCAPPVETLRCGDEILTASGKAVAVKWQGHQKIHNNMFTWPARTTVCISSGTLGDNLPHSDLFLTVEHGLILPVSGKGGPCPPHRIRRQRIWQSRGFGAVEKASWARWITLEGRAPNHLHRKGCKNSQL